ncbi:MAG: hypothetical protein WD556_02875 [Actinomycetota bacterium]
MPAPAPAPDDVPPASRRDRPSSGSARTVLIVALPALAVAVLFLAPYLLHDHVVPVGSDTAQGIWRARVVTELGLDGLPPSGPALLDASTERPGLPVTMALLHAATGLDPFEQSFVLPAVVAAAIALAAGALAVAAFSEPRWSFPVYALLVGASLNVELMAAGYFDNLFAATAVLAACLTVLLAVDGRRGIVLSIVLLGGAVLFHWMFAMLFAGLLALLWIGLLPSSLRSRSAGTGALGTPAGRLAAILGGAALVGGAGLVAAPNALTLSSGPPRSEVLDKLGRLLPVGAFVPAGIMAAVGGWFLEGTSRRRWGRVLLVLWTASAVVAGIAVVLGVRVPAHRIAAFALGFPVLVAAGVVGLGRLGACRFGSSRRRGLGVAAAVVMVAAGMALTAASWSARPPFVNAVRLAQVEEIARIVDGVEPGTPVVVVADAPSLPGYGATPAIRRIRAVLDPSRVGDVHAFLGEPDDLLAGRPTVRIGDPAFTKASRELWAATGPAIAAAPVIVLSRLYYKDFDATALAHPEAAVGDGLLVLGSPLPPAAITARSAPSVAFLAFATLGLALVIGIAGIGWSWTLLAARAADRIALAPAVGLAVLAISGLVADRVGIAIGSVGGIAIVVVAAVAGWVPLVGRRLR